VKNYEREEERKRAYHNDCGFENARRQTLVRKDGSTVDVNFILDVDIVTENRDTFNSALCTQEDNEKSASKSETVSSVST